MRKSQLLIILMLLALLLAINQLLTGPSSLRRYLGGLPWYGWAGITIFLAAAGIWVAIRDAKRAGPFLEEPLQKNLYGNAPRGQLSEKVVGKYYPEWPDSPPPG